MTERQSPRRISSKPSRGVCVCLYILLTAISLVLFHPRALTFIYISLIQRPTYPPCRRRLPRPRLPNIPPCSCCCNFLYVLHVQGPTFSHKAHPGSNTGHYASSVRMVVHLVVLDCQQLTPRSDHIDWRIFCFVGKEGCRTLFVGDRPWLEIRKSSPAMADAIWRESISLGG